MELGNPANVIYEFPEEYRPVLDTKLPVEGSIDVYDINVQDFIKAGLLMPGSKLYMSYKPRSTQERRTYEAIIEDDGTLRAGNQSFSPSYAALYYINEAGSPRKTVNGWNVWKTEEGVFLTDLRDRFLKEHSRRRGGKVGRIIGAIDNSRFDRSIRYPTYPILDMCCSDIAAGYP